MGCTSSSSVPADDPNAPKDLKEKASKQRRRLSVSPEQVGDISAVEKAEKDAHAAAVARRASDEAAANGSNSALTDSNNNNANGTAPASSAAAVAAEEKQPSREEAHEVKAPVKLAYCELSKKGFVPYNRNKVNQDRAVIVEHLQNQNDLSLFAVMDGHGEFGHLVAQFVKEKLPVHLEQQPNLVSDTPAAMTNAVKRVVDELAETHINVAFSGTTLVFAVKNRDKLFVGNVGDSRCVLCRKHGDGKLEAIPLTIDQKPDNPDEKARILRAGGRVEPLPGPPGEDCGPNRVWLAEVDVPGLAMSRSIGDEVSQSVGVISVPEVKEHSITKEDMFIVLASDGVWEFIQNEDACSLVHAHWDNLRAGANDLVQASHKKWEQEEEVVDDITCIILSLRY